MLEMNKKKMFIRLPSELQGLMLSKPQNDPISELISNWHDSFASKYTNMKITLQMFLTFPCSIQFPSFSSSVLNIKHTSFNDSHSQFFEPRHFYCSSLIHALCSRGKRHITYCYVESMINEINLEIRLSGECDVREREREREIVTREWEWKAFWHRSLFINF